MRTKLSQMLHEICDNVYYQQPPTSQMKYPCIRYEEAAPHIRRADNEVYTYTEQYIVTAIDKNPDSAMKRQLAELPMCSFDRITKADNLYHFVFSIYC